MKSWRPSSQQLLGFPWLPFSLSLFLASAFVSISSVLLSKSARYPPTNGQVGYMEGQGCT